MPIVSCKSDCDSDSLPWLNVPRERPCGHALGIFGRSLPKKRSSVGQYESPSLIDFGRSHDYAVVVELALVVSIDADSER